MDNYTFIAMGYCVSLIIIGSIMYCLGKSKGYDKGWKNGIKIVNSLNTSSKKGCGKNLRKWYFDNEGEVSFWKCGEDDNYCEDCLPTKTSTEDKE